MPAFIGFEGYLIRATKTGTVFPVQLMQWDTYKGTPNQREEIKAYRDDNSRDLTRITADGKKTKFEFKTRPLWLEDRAFIQNWLETNFDDSEQRKISLRYWDDEELVYKTGTFYIPNIDYSIIKITDDNIKYKEIQFTFIEY